MSARATRSTALVLLAALVAACTGSAPTPATGGSPGASPGSTVGTASGSPTGSDAAGPVTVYAGRSEELVGPLLDEFTSATGLEVEVRYGDTAELAATILEEGDNSPADVFFAQDAGALGALAAEGRLGSLPTDILEQVPDRFRSPAGDWVGVSGRVRVVVYNPELVDEADLPDSILGYTDPEWQGRIGWAPTNASFQAFVTALRLTEGEDAARSWLEGIKANDPQVFDGNTPIVEAVAAGEIAVGFVNHYYLMRLKTEHGNDYGAENHYSTSADDPGSLVNVAGAGILATTDQPSAAQEVVRYLLAEESQSYFATETYEYPLVEGVDADERLPALDEIRSPDLDLSQLADLEGTLDLLADVGVL